MFQSCNQQDQETQEVTMFVSHKQQKINCVSIRLSQKINRLKSMNSSLNSFLEWQKWLDIHESD